MEQNKTIEEIIESIERDNKDLKVIIKGDTYITVENEEGYRAYMEIDKFGSSPEFFSGFIFATVHRPNKKTGTGYRFGYLQFDVTMDTVVNKLRDTLKQSKENIKSGDERMDTRKPHESGKYLV